jgi:hypothetical protein
MGLLGLALYDKEMREKKYINQKYSTHNYSNKNAVKYLIEYITRSRPNENRKGDLIGYGAAGIPLNISPQQMISVIENTQKNTYMKAEVKGPRMSHIVFNFTESEMAMMCYDYGLLWSFAEECTQLFYNIGFQVVFAIHYDPGKRYHIHFAVSTVNFLTGKKLCMGIPDVNHLGRIYNDLLVKYLMVHNHSVTPIRFASCPIRFLNGENGRWTQTEEYTTSFPQNKVYDSSCNMSIPKEAIPDLRKIPDYNLDGIVSFYRHPDYETNGLTDA